jgi:Fic family protein
MSLKENFEFINSELWLKYTQERYLTLEDIRYRVQKTQNQSHLKNWDETRDKIQSLRKLGSIPFFVTTLEKKFWYFPADCIQRLLHQIDTLGIELYDKIITQQYLLEDLLNNSTVEEAVTSAIYEGANTTRARAKTILEAKLTPKNKDEWMVMNNYEALTWIKKNKHEEVSLNLMLKIHQMVTRNTMDGDDKNFSGKFRNDKVFVGTHEGSPHSVVESALTEIIKLTTFHQRYLHGLIKGILLHYFTAYIHPFFDGNGRTARGLFYFKAIKNNLKFVELLSISAHLKEHGKKYEKSFDLVVENDNDLTYFIQFCLESLLAALREVKIKVDYLTHIGELKEKLDLQISQVHLIQKMALHKYRSIDVEEYGKSLGKSREIARQQLKELHGFKILREEKVGKKFVYYIDSDVLKTKILENIPLA